MPSLDPTTPSPSAPRRIVRRSVPPAAATPGQNYDRARDLPRLVTLWPEEIADISPAARLRLVAKLQSQLRRERQRGLAGHWTYDLARHRQLLIAYQAEKKAAVRVCTGELASSSHGVRPMGLTPERRSQRFVAPGRASPPAQTNPGAPQ